MTPSLSSFTALQAIIDQRGRATLSASGRKCSQRITDSKKRTSFYMAMIRHYGESLTIGELGEN